MPDRMPLTSSVNFGSSPNLPLAMNTYPGPMGLSAHTGHSGYGQSGGQSAEGQPGDPANPYGNYKLSSAELANLISKRLTSLS